MFKTLNLILKPLETIRYSIDICFLHTLISNWFGGSEIKVSACNAGDLGLIPESGRFPWRSKWQPTPVLLPGEPHGRRSLVGYSPRGRKESGTTERLHFHFHNMYTI